MSCLIQEKKKWEGKIAEKENKLKEEVAKARQEEKRKWEGESASLRRDLLLARQELADQKEAMPRCAICFERFEGTIPKRGQKRGRDDGVLRKRGCFSPCMHTGMCLECSVQAWEKYKRCPVCSNPCSLKPRPIFM